MNPDGDPGSAAILPNLLGQINQSLRSGQLGKSLRHHPVEEGARFRIPVARIRTNKCRFPH
jgi:hypothetical protein